MLQSNPQICDTKYPSSYSVWRHVLLGKRKRERGREIMHRVTIPNSWFGECLLRLVPYYLCCFMYMFSCLVSVCETLLLSPTTDYNNIQSGLYVLLVYKECIPISLFFLQIHPRKLQTLCLNRRGIWYILKRGKELSCSCAMHSSFALSTFFCFFRGSNQSWMRYGAKVPHIPSRLDPTRHYLSSHPCCSR